MALSGASNLKLEAENEYVAFKPGQVQKHFWNFRNKLMELFLFTGRSPCTTWTLSSTRTKDTATPGTGK